MRKEIEVAVGKSTSNTERGKLLEKLAREMLETMQYSVTQQVRITGIEVDLLAVHKPESEHARPRPDGIQWSLRLCLFSAKGNESASLSFI